MVVFSSPEAVMPARAITHAVPSVSSSRINATDKLILIVVSINPYVLFKLLLFGVKLMIVFSFLIFLVVFVLPVLLGRLLCAVIFWIGWEVV